MEGLRSQRAGPGGRGGQLHTQSGAPLPLPLPLPLPQQRRACGVGNLRLPASAQLRTRAPVPPSPPKRTNTRPGLLLPSPLPALQVHEASIPHSVECIINPEAPLALRLSGDPSFVNMIELRHSAAAAAARSPASRVPLPCAPPRPPPPG
jgi:hypothetical protein